MSWFTVRSSGAGMWMALDLEREFTHRRATTRHMSFALIAKADTQHTFNTQHCQHEIMSRLWLQSKKTTKLRFSGAWHMFLLFLCAIRDHLFFGTGSFCYRGQFREETLPKMSCPDSSTFSSYKNVSPTPHGAWTSPPKYIHKTCYCWIYVWSSTSPVSFLICFIVWFLWSLVCGEKKSWK